jgi:peptide/nickel transport system ATP-binding protein
VSIRMGVLNLLADLGQEQGLAILYITHDIASARYFADTVSVMYAGRLVEGGTAEDVTQEPAHPYTQVLVDAAPDPDRLQRGRRLMVRGSTPHSGAAAVGCSFAPRCPQAMARCAEETPPTFEVAPGHWATGWLYDGKPAHGLPVQIAANPAAATNSSGSGTRSAKKTYSTKSQPEESGLSQ